MDRWARHDMSLCHGISVSEELPGESKLKVREDPML